jgi:hypothetical protein
MSIGCLIFQCMLTYFDYWFEPGQDIIGGLPDIVDKPRSGNQHHPSPKIGDFKQTWSCLKVGASPNRFEER